MVDINIFIVLTLPEPTTHLFCNCAHGYNILTRFQGFISFWYIEVETEGEENEN